MSESKRWKPGYAARAAEMTPGLVPWQRDLLRRIEDADVDAEFRDLTSGLDGSASGAPDL